MFSPQTLIVSRLIYSKDRDCGYCHGKKHNSYLLQSFRDQLEDDSHSVTIGMSLENISLTDYEFLCNKGFRRSGDFLYKPDLLRNCCRLYTIRTSYGMFKMNKDQRKSMNRFFKALGYENKDKPKAKNSPIDMYEEFSRMESTIDGHKFRTKLDTPKFTDEKFQLYKKYQVHVHNDDPADVTPKSFKRFLCNNPFHESKPREGHVHELYYIDDKLALILVLDILPNGISSVYFIWDPDHHKLGLGKVSSLRELNLCRKLGKQWYYLGYYIPDCEKMKYKLKFGGELLDVTDYKYYKIEELEKRDFVNLEKDLLFVVGDDQRDEEKFIDETDLFKSYSLSPSSKNIAENIYRYGKDEYDLEKPKETSEEDLFKFPNVVPGLIPLKQIEKQLKSRLKNMVISIYNPFEGLSQFKYGQNSAQDKIVVDIIRVLGFEMIDNSVLVIY